MAEAGLPSSRGGTHRERRLTRSDGRKVAWLEAGMPEGRPVLRLPGTPGSRFQIRADQSPWVERHLRVIMTERPGFGASNRDPALSWHRYADDLAAIMDALEVASAPAYAGSGGAPYLLAFAARHPERARAISIISGAAPITAAELPSMMELNAAGHRLAHAADRDGMSRLLAPVRQSLLDDPLASVRVTMASAPPADQMIIDDPAWQHVLVRGVREALRQGVEAWVDEAMLMFAGWDALDPTEVPSTVTWWHGADDRNCPLTAVQRLVRSIPKSELRVWRESGHLAAYHREGDILDELLSRAG